MAGSTQDAGCDRGPQLSRGWEMPAAGRTGGQSLSPGSALLKEKRLLVTGREWRQPRAHAPPPPLERTHPDPLPPPTSPACRLPSSPGPRLQRRLLHARLRRASDPAPTHRGSRSELAVSNSLAWQPRRSCLFLQLRSSCSRLLSVRPQLQRSAPAPPLVPPLGPRPRTRANQRSRLRPTPLAPRPLPLPLGCPPPSRRPKRGGARVLRTLPVTRLAFRPRRGDALDRPVARYLGCGALWVCTLPDGQPAAGRLREERRQGWGRSRTSSDLEAAFLNLES